MYVIYYFLNFPESGQVHYRPRFCTGHYPIFAFHILSRMAKCYPDFLLNCVEGGGTVESHESRNGAREDFLEPVQWSPSICLKCGQQAVASGKLEFFVSSCWLGCLSSTLTRFSAIPTFMRFYGIAHRYRYLRSPGMCFPLTSSFLFILFFLFFARASSGAVIVRR